MKITLAILAVGIAFNVAGFLIPSIQFVDGLMHAFGFVVIGYALGCVPHPVTES